MITKMSLLISDSLHPLLTPDIIKKLKDFHVTTISSLLSKVQDNGELYRIMAPCYVTAMYSVKLSIILYLPARRAGQLHHQDQLQQGAKTAS